MKRAALIWVCCSVGAFAGGASGKSLEVSVAGKTYTVPLDGHEALLVVTPEIRMDGITTLQRRALSRPGLDLFWVFKFEVRVKGRSKVEIFSPVAPRLITSFEVDSPRWVERMELPYTACPEVWAIALDGTNESWMPFIVRITPMDGGQTTEITQWKLLSPDMKGWIQKRAIPVKSAMSK